MKLNSPRVRDLLQEQDRSVAWLGRKIGITRYAMWHQIRNESPKNTDKIASALNVKPTSIIIWEG